MKTVSLCKCNFTVSHVPGSTDLYATKACKLSKQDFLSAYAWRYLTADDKETLFRGLYAADGSVDRNQITTTDDLNAKRKERVE
jgi:hypothetical protein